MRRYTWKEKLRYIYKEKYTRIYTKKRNIQHHIQRKIYKVTYMEKII